MRVASIVVAGILLVGLSGSGRAVSALAAKADDVRLVRVPDSGLQPEAIMDGAGVLHLLYFKGDPAHGDLFSVRSRDEGATFSAPLRVNSQDGSAIAVGTIRGGTLALGRNGRVHAAWNGSGTALPKSPDDPKSKTGSPSAMLYARLNDAGTAFEAQRSVITRTGGVDGGGAVAADAAGHVFVAWHANDLAAKNPSEASRRVWLARSANDGRTFEAETTISPATTGVCGCCGLEILSSASGLFLLYRSATEMVHRDVHLLASTDRGQTFRDSPVAEWNVNGCQMTSMSLVPDGSRTLAAWETMGKVYLGAVEAGRSAVPAPVAAANESSAKHPRLASNGHGQTLMVWAEGTGWTKGGGLAWQMFTGTTPAGPATRRPGIPAWSFAAPVARRDGGFIVLY